MKKGLFIAISLSVLIIIGILYLIKIQADKQTFDENILEENGFENLIQYETESATDIESTNHILRNIHFGEYFIKTELEFVGNKEHLTIYYDCLEEKEIKQYYIETKKRSILEKNTVTLFALINNLEEITYKFTVSDTELAKRNKIPLINGVIQTIQEKITRQLIEKYYNRDVKNYVANPEEFMKYDINLNINKITIYKENLDNSINIIDINDSSRIEKISNYILAQNFNVADTGTNMWWDIWVDLHNGYMIGTYSDIQDDDSVGKNLRINNQKGRGAGHF